MQQQIGLRSVEDLRWLTYQCGLWLRVGFFIQTEMKFMNVWKVLINYLEICLWLNFPEIFNFLIQFLKKSVFKFDQFFLQKYPQKFQSSAVFPKSTHLPQTFLTKIPRWNIHFSRWPNATRLKETRLMN